MWTHAQEQAPYRRLRWSAHAAVLLWVAMTAGCRPRANKASIPLALGVRDSSGVAVLTLSRSLSAVARGNVIATTLRRDLLVGRARNDIGHIADVAELDGGRVAVLDRKAQSIRVFSADGLPVGVWAPSLLPDAIAMARVGQHIVILGADSAKALVVLDTLGRIVASSPRPFRADWTLFQFREPITDWDMPFQRGPEDVSRRLRAFDDTSFVLQVQPDERRLRMVAQPGESALTMAELVRFSVRLKVLDTTASLPAAVSVRLQPETDHEFPRFAQPIFEARPVWATGTGWYAYGQSGSPVIQVRSTSGKLMATVGWRDSVALVTESERLDASLWSIRYTLILQPTVAGWWHGWSARKREEVLRHQMGSLAYFAGHRPAFTAAYGDGACLWLAGFSPSFFIDGTAGTWVGVNVLTHRLVGVVSLPRIGSHVRTVSGGAFYTSYIDSSAVEHLERYPIPNSPRCR